jgi:hypothetical protein
MMQSAKRVFDKVKRVAPDCPDVRRKHQPQPRHAPSTGAFFALAARIC